jgi:hypothetical protein
LCTDLDSMKKNRKDHSRIILEKPNLILKTITEAVLTGHQDLIASTNNLLK